MQRLEGRRAVVTGAAAGIGAAIARRLHDEGARVLVTDRDGEAAERTAAELGAPARSRRLDVVSGEDIRGAIEDTRAAWGGLDILVNNAGVGSAGSVVETGEDELDRLLAVNVRGTFLTMKHAMPLLREEGGGAVVNISSIAALVGLPSRAAYSATKGAVYALTRAAAIDHIGEGVRINCVAPGTVDTPWVDRIAAEAGELEAQKERMRLRQPHGRFVTPEEIAAMVAYLVSDEAASVVGACMVVDGGATAR